MSAAALALIAGTALSLAFSYIPRADGSFKKQNGVTKRLIMLGCLVLTSGIVYGLSCIGWGSAWGITVVCDQPGLLGLVGQFTIAMIANQSAFAISPQKKVVKKGPLQKRVK